MTLTNDLFLVVILTTSFYVFIFYCKRDTSTTNSPEYHCQGFVSFNHSTQEIDPKANNDGILEHISQNQDSKINVPVAKATGFCNIKSEQPMTKAIRMVVIITTTLASEGCMKLSYHLILPPSNTRSRAQTIEQIKFAEPTIHDKVLMSRKLPLNVNTWQTSVLLEFYFTMALVRNSFAVNPLPMLSAT